MKIKVLIVISCIMGMLVPSTSMLAAEKPPLQKLLKVQGSVHSDNLIEPMRPPIIARNGVVSSGRYLASMIGYDILKKGGNAFDAGVAAAAAVTLQKMYTAGWCGVSPFLGYSAKEGKVIYRAGVGTAPKLATPELFASRGHVVMPYDGNLASIMPTNVDSYVAILQEYGTMSLAEVLEGAIRLAEEGFPADAHWVASTQEVEKIKKWPYNASIFLVDGRAPKLGDLIVQKDLGKTMRLLVDAEQKALRAGKSRREALEAARDVFYKGEIAWAIDKFYKEIDGLVRYEDLANFKGEWRTPVTTNYKGIDVYTTDTVSVGPLNVQYLNMLENFDLVSLGYNSPEYIHLLWQVVSLAMSDRWNYFGDPNFVNVPDGLFTKEYAKERIKLIDPNKAFTEMPAKSNPFPFNKKAAAPSSQIFASLLKDVATPRPTVTGKVHADNDNDTTYVSVFDKQGNMFSMTPSDGQPDHPVIPGYGFSLGSRGYRFTIGFPGQPAQVAPGKRPMNTTQSIIALKNGKPYMILGTPGADESTQQMLQVFLNMIEFGMNVQQAIEQPRMSCTNFPTTGSPYTYNKGQIRLERGLGQAVADGLAKKGYGRIVWLPDWNLSSICSIVRDDNGTLWGGADIRRESYAVGW